MLGEKNINYVADNGCNLALSIRICTEIPAVGLSRESSDKRK